MSISYTETLRRSINKSKVVALKDSLFGNKLIKNSDMKKYKFRGHAKY